MSIIVTLPSFREYEERILSPVLEPFALENPLRLVLMPSLEQMALRRLAIALYSVPDILASMATFPCKEAFANYNMWDYVSDYRGNASDWRQAVLDRVSALGLPDSLRKQMVPTVKAVGSEICTWKWIHEEYLGSQLTCLQKLCWTSAGAVDYKRTARRLVSCDDLGVGQRFELACRYCLEDDSLPLLWRELTDEDRRTFCDPSRVETPHLGQFLPKILKKQSEIENEVGPSRNAFEKAALCGNKALAEFCFWSLTEEERGASLVRTTKKVLRVRTTKVLRWSDDESHHHSHHDVRREKLSDVLCWLLSLMTAEEQTGVFRELPWQVLRCFLVWPWQDLASDIADVVWACLPQWNYKTLVLAIWKSMHSVGHYFPRVFQTLFLRSPREFRKCVVDEEIRRGYFLLYLARQEDTESIRVIFRNIDAADRVRLASCKDSLNIIFAPSIKWRVVEVLLREATLSKEDKRRLKEDFIAFCPEYRNSINRLRMDYVEFFEFVEESAEKAETLEM